MLNHGGQPAPLLPRRATIKAYKNLLATNSCEVFGVQEVRTSGSTPPHQHNTREGMNVNFTIFKACLKECVEALFVVYTCYATCIRTVVEHLHGGSQ